jgi:hypothetical protein
MGWATVGPDGIAERLDLSPLSRDRQQVKRSVIDPLAVRVVNFTDQTSCAEDAELLALESQHLQPRCDFKRRPPTRRPNTEAPITRVSETRAGTDPEGRSSDATLRAWSARSSLRRRSAFKRAIPFPS